MSLGQLSTPAPAFGSRTQVPKSTRRTGPATASWRIGNLAGIPVSVHASFGLLIGWVALTQLVHGDGLFAIVLGLLLVVAIFACVVLHELSHALMARRFGIATREITLLPIGGLARLERMPDRSSQELLVAIVGPLTSFAIALALYVPLRLLGGPVEGSFLTQLMWINVALAGFNLLPAFPMDGGRVLRAALTPQLGRVRATRVAARIGQGLAVGLGVLGLLGNPFLILIAVFVWLGARSEAKLVEVKAALSGVAVMQAMITSFEILSAGDSLARAVKLGLGGFQRDFPVTERGELVGVLTRSDVLRGLSDGGPSTPVGRVMTRSFATVAPWDTLDMAVDRLQQSESKTLVVVQQGTPVGLVTAENITQLLTLARAQRDPSLASATEQAPRVPSEPRPL